MQRLGGVLVRYEYKNTASADDRQDVLLVAKEAPLCLVNGAA